MASESQASGKSPGGGLGDAAGRNASRAGSAAQRQALDCGRAEESSEAFDPGRAVDDELLSRLALGKGRETALPELFRRHGPRALRLAVRILGDWQIAEEAVQDAFLRLAEKASLWRGEAGFGTFFTRILINVCRNIQRRGHDFLAKGRAVGSPSQLLGGVAASSRVTEVARRLEREEQCQAVREAIGKLPEKYREVLVLRELEGLHYREIAEVLEVSLDEVRTWIYRGRVRLRSLLEEGAGERTGKSDG